MVVPCMSFTNNETKAFILASHARNESFLMFSMWHMASLNHFMSSVMWAPL